MLYGQADQFSITEYLAQKPIFVWLITGLLFLVGISLGSFGVYTIVSSNEQEIVTSTDITAQVCQQTADFGQITVYISGAVVSPGVYILQNGDRVADLLTAAGGIDTTADKVYINKQFNLASLLTDEQQLYIPTATEVTAQLGTLTNQSQNTTENPTTNTTGTQTVASAQRLISINSSTSKQLTELSGIGEVRAEKIIANRPYSSLTELVDKSVLTQSLFEEIKNKIEL